MERGEESSKSGNMDQFERRQSTPVERGKVDPLASSVFVACCMSANGRKCFTEEQHLFGEVRRLWLLALNYLCLNDHELLGRVEGAEKGLVYRVFV